MKQCYTEDTLKKNTSVNTKWLVKISSWFPFNSIIIVSVSNEFQWIYPLEYSVPRVVNVFCVFTVRLRHIVSLRLLKKKYTPGKYLDFTHIRKTSVSGFGFDGSIFIQTHINPILTLAYVWNLSITSFWMSRTMSGTW